MAKPNNKKEFAPSVGLWPTQTGTGYRVFLDEKALGELQKAQEGGSLYLQEIPEDKRTNPKSPHFRLTIFPPDEQPRQESKADSI